MNPSKDIQNKIISVKHAPANQSTDSAYPDHPFSGLRRLIQNTNIASKTPVSQRTQLDYESSPYMKKSIDIGPQKTPLSEIINRNEMRKSLKHTNINLFQPKQCSNNCLLQRNDEHLKLTFGVSNMIL